MQVQANAATISLPVLQVDASGEAVRLLQKLLILAGNKISFDAHFGADTKNAVINFQKKNSLTTDGIVGQNTWHPLIDLIRV